MGTERRERRSNGVPLIQNREPNNKNKTGQPINHLNLSRPAIICAIFFASTASADIHFDYIAIIETVAVKKFDGLRQHGVVLRYSARVKSRRFWTPNSMELSTGWIDRGNDTSFFVTFGPTYRAELGKSQPGRWFVDFASQPTYISKSDFGGKSLGGKFFFTSYLGIGAYLGRQRKTTFIVRFQHTSNAGLDGNNPGVDMVGLTLSYRFGRNRRHSYLGAVSPEEFEATERLFRP